MVRTLVDVLQQAASVTAKATCSWTIGCNESVWSFADLSREAARRARIFRTLGLKKGDRIAMIVPDGEDFVLSFSVQCAPGWSRCRCIRRSRSGKLDSYIDAAARIIGTSGARMLLTSKAVAPIVWSLVDRGRDARRSAARREARELRRRRDHRVDRRHRRSDRSDPCVPPVHLRHHRRDPRA